MPIDPRSALGQTIGAGEGICIDPSELTQTAGRELARRIEAGQTGAEAVVGFMVETAKYAGKDVIAFDGDKLFEANPDLYKAVGALMVEGKLTRGQALTKLMIEGAKTVGKKEPAARTKTGDPIRDFLQDLLPKDLFSHDPFSRGL